MIECFEDFEHWESGGERENAKKSRRMDQRRVGMLSWRVDSMSILSIRWRFSMTDYYFCH